MDEVKITIIGTGVVGLAIAAELSKKHEGILVVERHAAHGQETSSRNSEVIHSGIYYPRGSLKAKLCVRGAELLYEICKRNDMPHKKTGKLIVATETSEIKILEALRDKGKHNDVKGLSVLEKNEALRIEPNANLVAALYSPDTGILNVHSLMKHFHHEAEGNDVLFAFGSNVESITKDGQWYVVRVKEEDYSFRTKVLINSAGLSSDRVAEMAGIDITKNDYTIKLCKGSYFSYSKPSPVKMLVYPVPHEELVGLGVHATVDIGGRLRFGPDAEYVDTIDYKVDASKRDAFYEGAIKIIKGLDKDSFIPDMAGIRPKLQGPGEKTRDFVIKEESENGLPGLINLIGIESPGLTASPAIAEMVSEMVSGILD